MSGDLLLFLLFFVGLVATTASLMRAQRQSREVEARRAKAIEAKVSQMRQETEEDVTTFGEALRDLDMEMIGKEVSAEGRKDWNTALDCYDRAKTLMAQDKGTRSIPLVTETLEEGRHSIACVQARANGEPIPEVRPPCFFDPAHGPSTTDVMYSHARFRPAPPTPSASSRGAPRGSAPSTSMAPSCPTGRLARTTRRGCRATTAGMSPTQSSADWPSVVSALLVWGSSQPYLTTSDPLSILRRTPRRFVEGSFSRCVSWQVHTTTSLHKVLQPSGSL